MVQNQIHPSFLDKPQRKSLKSSQKTLPTIKKGQISPSCINRLQGLLIGLIISTANSVAILLVLWLTRICSTNHHVTSIESSTTPSCDELQWNPMGITVAGNGTAGAASNQLNFPLGIDLGPENTLYVADFYNHRVQKWLANANNGITVAGQTGISSSAPQHLNRPRTVIVDSQSNFYVVEFGGCRVQLWLADSSVGTTVAGSSSSLCGSGLNQFNQSYDVHIDSITGDLYVSDLLNCRIMRWTPGTTNGSIFIGHNGCGSASNQVSGPRGIIVEDIFNGKDIYWVTAEEHVLIRWPADATEGIIIAGKNATRGNASDSLNTPRDITCDPYGNFYIPDIQNHRIQMFCRQSNVGRTIAGMNSSFGATSEKLYQPWDVAFDSDLNLYVADAGNNRVQKFMRLMNSFTHSSGTRKWQILGWWSMPIYMYIFHLFQ